MARFWQVGEENDGRQPKDGLVVAQEAEDEERVGALLAAIEQGIAALVGDHTFAGGFQRFGHEQEDEQQIDNGNQGGQQDDGVIRVEAAQIGAQSLKNANFSILTFFNQKIPGM